MRDWAENTASPAYTFANQGREGHNGTDGAVPSADGTELEPVTYVNWRDVMIWCNALTEYNNDQNGTSLECVYYTDSAYTTPIRISTNNSVNMVSGQEDQPYIKAASAGNIDMLECAANGFRLPASNEWELAARFIADSNTDGDILDSGEYYPGGYASGASADYNNSTATGEAAWYSGNSGSATHPAGEKTANALGLYDMSGNVWEWCFDRYTSGSYRVLRGGGWYYDASGLQVGDVYSYIPGDEDGGIGFRPARTP